MIPAVVLAHADLARSLIETVEAFTGPQEGLRALSNRGCGMSEIASELDKAAAALGGGPLVVFVDLLGGSCGQAARTLLRDHAEWRLVTGVNVPMLVNFVQNRARLPLDELTEMLVARARDGVQRFPGTT
jgi:mannose/fructose-specific phosphotransferase system component IIA